MNAFAFYTQIAYALTAAIYLLLALWVIYHYRRSKRALTKKDVA